jgi:glycosyltransferase involved in cell wall biosynthesis
MDVSILIICHHDRGYLQQAIDSARAQDFKGSFEVVIQKADLTMSQNNNVGTLRCKGEYIKWLHDDDILEPSCLTDLWVAKGADVICANAYNFWQEGEEYVDEAGDIASRLPSDINEMIDHYSIHAGTLMYRRQVLIDNPLDESLLTGEEFELNLRLFSLGYRFAYVNKNVTRYRIHNKMKSFSAYGIVDAQRKADRQRVLESIRERYRTIKINSL